MERPLRRGRLHRTLVGAIRLSSLSPSLPLAPGRLRVIRCDHRGGRRVQGNELDAFARTQVAAVLLVRSVVPMLVHPEARDRPARPVRVIAALGSRLASEGHLVEVVVDRACDDGRKRGLVAQEIQRHRDDRPAVPCRQYAGGPPVVEGRALPLAGGIEAVLIVLGRVEGVDEVEDRLAARLAAAIQVDQAVERAHALHHSGPPGAALDRYRRMRGPGGRGAVCVQDRAQVVLGGDGHAGHRVPLHSGHVDQVRGVGEAGREIEGLAAVREGDRLREIRDGLLAPIGPGRIDKVDAGKLAGGAVEDRGGDEPGRVVDSDVRRGDPGLPDELPQQRLRQLRRYIGGIGPVSMAARLVQVELYRDLLARAVADIPAALALVEFREDLPPALPYGGSVADRPDRVGEHLVDGRRGGVAVVPPSRRVGRPVPRGGAGVKGPCHAARPYAEGGAHRRIHRLGRDEGRLALVGALPIRRRGRASGENDGGRGGGKTQRPPWARTPRRGGPFMGVHCAALLRLGISGSPGRSLVRRWITRRSAPNSESWPWRAFTGFVAPQSPRRAPYSTAIGDGFRPQTRYAFLL